MTRALAALLTRAIDYAGVFPPAKLDLEVALDKYSRYRSGPEAWIVGKYVVRSSQLNLLAAKISDLGPSDPFSISVIGRTGSNRETWESGLAQDAADINAFLNHVGERAAVDAYEVRLPDNVNAASWLGDLHGFSDAEIYAELSWDEHLSDAIAAAAESEFVNIKARTGGEIAAAFPESRQVAAFIQEAVQLSLPFKFTAGLHNASPHFDENLSVRLHGFVNVFAATAFTVAQDLSQREIEAVLDADQPGVFTLTDFGLTGLDWSATLENLHEARELLVAFGSCSIDEPLEALRHAGLEID